MVWSPGVHVASTSGSLFDTCVRPRTSKRERLYASVTNRKCTILVVYGELEEMAFIAAVIK